MSYKTNASAVNGLIDVKLVNYTTTADLNTALSAKADTSALADYVLSSALTTTLGDYVTSTALTTTLAGYVTDGELSTAIADFITAADLSGYVTTAALSTALGDYTTSADLTTLLGGYVETADLTAALSDYALTSSLGTAAFLNSGSAAGNVVVLDGAGKINSAYLPALDVVDVHVVANTAARDALTGMSNGDIAVVEDINTTYIWDGTTWIELKTPAGSFSGDYNDLTNKPTLFSGAYADLTGKPTLGTAAAQDIEFFATAAQGAKADTALQASDLEGYALLTDISNALVDYTTTADLTTALNLKANAADVYAKTEVYTKSEVDTLIDGVSGSVDTSMSTVAIVTGSTTLTSANHVVIVNKGSAVATITLDAAPATGKTVTIKDGSGNAAAFNVTIDGNGKNIDGASSLVINIDYEAVTVVYNGTQWNII